MPSPVPLAAALLLAEPPTVAIAIADPDWEVGRERVTVALTDAGILPFAAGAQGRHPLAEVQATCRRDAHTVEVHLLDQRGDVYEVHRVAGRGCTLDAGTEAAARVVEQIKASCRDRPCTADPSPAGPADRSRLSLRAGLGVLGAPVSGLGPTGALSLGAAWAVHPAVALELDGTATVISSARPAIPPAAGLGITRAHLVFASRMSRFRLEYGIGGGLLVAWALPHPHPDGRDGIGTRGIVSTALRGAVDLTPAWAAYCAVGAAFALPPLGLRAGAVFAVVDATAGLRWRPRRRAPGRSRSRSRS